MSVLLKRIVLPSCTKTKRKSQSNRSNNIQCILCHCPFTSLLKYCKKLKPNTRYRSSYRIKMYSCVKETTIDSEIKNTIVCNVIKMSTIPTEIM